MNKACKIKKSIDGGLTWKEQNKGEKNRYSHIRAFDEKLVWANGGDGIFRTSNGGETWESMYRYDGNREMVMNITIASRTTLWGVSERGRYSDSYTPFIAKSTNGGRTWRDQDMHPVDGDWLTIENHCMNDVHAVSNEIAWVAGEYGLYARTVNGKDWEAGLTDVVNGEDLKSICAIDANIAWAVGGKTVWKTEDGGDYWSKVYPPFTMREMSNI